MTAIKFIEERRPLAKAFKASREKLDYKRATFGLMLGYNGNNCKKRVQEFESGHRQIPQHVLRKVHDWITLGLPEDAPEPDLLIAKATYFEKMRQGKPKFNNRENVGSLQPGTINLNAKEDA